MKIRELFSKPINRPINGVIKADYTADAEAWMQKAMTQFPGEASIADTPEEAARHRALRQAMQRIHDV